ncbi:hypothetical protein ScPMuIL_010705 [Solemya velum]
MAYPNITSQPATQTTVVMAPGGQFQGKRNWSSGMCDCFNDMTSCLCVTFLGPYYAMSLASRMGESACVPCCVPGSLIVMRTKLRTEQGIEGSICDDCLMSHFCGHCVLCQLARELNYTEQTRGAMSPSPY